MKPGIRQMIFGALLGIAVFGAWFPARHQIGLTVPMPSSRSSADVLASRNVPRVISRAKNWEEFQARFGKDLVAEFAADGRLIKAEMPLASDVAAEMVKPSGDFNSEDRAQAIVRAKEIVGAASGLLKRSPEFQLQEPAYDGGPYSAHVFFRETYQGRPILPWGTITVDLGHYGELRALYSTFMPSIELTNQIELSMDQAAVRANAPEDGRSIIWMMELQRKGLPKAQGKYAYEFITGGVQKIVDAEDGKILFERDRRIYH